MREKSAHFFIIELGTFFDCARTTYCDKNIPTRYVKRGACGCVHPYGCRFFFSLSLSFSLFFFLFVVASCPIIIIH